jgi:cell division protein FtsN
MRDVRYGSKSRVTLDQGQLIGLAFFAILSGGLMFALGYATGKNRRVVAPGEVSALSRIDQNHDRAREMKNDTVDLTFYRTLLEKEQRPKVDELVAASEKPAPSVEVKAPENKPDNKTEETLAAVAKEPAAKPSEPPLLKHSAPTPTAVVAAPAPAASGDFTIQVSAFRSDDEARAYVHKLQNKGFAASINPASLSGKGTWYRVRVGRFESDGAARLYKQKLDREGFPAWVVRAE